jgi:hypothetical protein
MTIRTYRRINRLLLPLAALPIFQTTGACDPLTFWTTNVSQFTGTAFNSFVSNAQATLLRNFPSADLLQILLGGQPRPFFTG